MAEIVPGKIKNIAQIPTRNHNDLQNRDMVDTHPESAITNLVTDLAGKVDKSGSITQIATRNHNDLQNRDVADAHSNITQITTRNHNDLQNRDVADAHSNITQITTRNHNDLQNRDVADAHSNITQITTRNIADLTDVTIVSPTTDQILKYNGIKWINGGQVAVGAGPGIIFYLDSTEIIPPGPGPQTFPIETLSKTPTGGVEVSESVTVNNSTGLIDQYLYNTGLGISSISAGEWTFDTYCNVDSASGVSEIIISVGKVFTGAGTIAITGAGTSRTATITGGTPFIASDFNADITQTSYIITPTAVLRIIGFTSTSIVTVETLATYSNETGVVYSVDRYLFQDTTGELNNLTVALVAHAQVQPAFAINTTDKLTVRYYGKTTNVGNIIITIYHNGTEHYTRIHAPLPTLHNDLAGLQGGISNEFYHSTLAEYTGIGTGPFVRDTGAQTSKLSKGYTAGGNTGAVSSVTEKYDDIANTWTAKTSLNTARDGLAGFSLNGYGYTAGGTTGAVSSVTEKYDDIANTWTAKANLNTARSSMAGFSLNGYGYTAGGWTGAVSSITEKYDDIANTWTAKTSLNTARDGLAGFSLNGYGYTAGGTAGAVSVVTEKYDDIANTWTAKANLNTARASMAGFSLNGYGYTAGGNTGAVSSVTEKYDDIANTWTAKTSLNTARDGLAGFSLNGYGYTAGGNTGAVSSVTEKYDDVVNTWTAKANLNTARYYVTGFSLLPVLDISGFKIIGSGERVKRQALKTLAMTLFLGGGNYKVRLGNRESNLFQFEGPKTYSVHVSNSTDVTLAGMNTIQIPAIFVTSKISGTEFLINNSMGKGFTAGGWTGAVSSVTEKYDDIAHTWTAKANLNTARASMAGFSLNGYGYTAGGTTGAVSSVTEKYDDIANTWTAKANLNTARSSMAGFSLNGYGYTAGGWTGAVSSITEKYDDIANTWTAKASLNTGRDYLAGFSLNGYGYTAGGTTGAVSAVTEKYDDVANTWTAKTSLNTARDGLAGFSLNGYGYTAGGNTGVVSTVTEKYDDVVNTWTAKANLNTARDTLAGFSLNGYGYTAGGWTGAFSAATEKYDDIANTWTVKPNINTARSSMAGFSLNEIHVSVTATGY